MPSPFPGMDSYLEHPDFWQETHHWFIVAIADSIMPQIRRKYKIAIKQRIYFWSPNFGQRIRTVKIFRVAQKRFRLNTQKYVQVI